VNNESKDDDWDDSESSVVECDSCGDILKCKYTEDPYIAEVYPEDENGEDENGEDENGMDWWCYRCWDKRHGDI
jgi:hypothetical protein